MICFVVSACNLRRQWLECVGHVNRELFVLLVQQIFYGPKLLKIDSTNRNSGRFPIPYSSPAVPPLCGDFIVVAARFFTDVEFTYITGLTLFKGCIHQSLKWNVCATHLINFFSILVLFVNFSDLCGATGGWFISSFLTMVFPNTKHRVKLFVCPVP